MTTKLSRLTAAARAGIAALRQVLGNSDAHGGLRSTWWRDEMVVTLEADLTNLDSLVHGFRRGCL